MGAKRSKGFREMPSGDSTLMRKRLVQGVSDYKFSNGKFKPAGLGHGWVAEFGPSFSRRRPRKAVLRSADFIKELLEWRSNSIQTVNRLFLLIWAIFGVVLAEFAHFHSYERITTRRMR